VVTPGVPLNGKLTQSSQLLTETRDTKLVRNPIREELGVEDCGE